MHWFCCYKNKALHTLHIAVDDISTPYVWVKSVYFQLLHQIMNHLVSRQQKQTTLNLKVNQWASKLGKLQQWVNILLLHRAEKMSNDHHDNDYSILFCNSMMATYYGGHFTISALSGTKLLYEIHSLSPQSTIKIQLVCSCISFIVLSCSFVLYIY